MGTEDPRRGVLIVDDSPLDGSARTVGDADPVPLAPTGTRPRRSLSETHEPVRLRMDDNARPILGRSGAPVGPESLVASSSGTVT